MDIKRAERVDSHPLTRRESMVKIRKHIRRENLSFTDRATRRVKAHPLASAAIAATATAAAAAGAFFWTHRDRLAA
jgi:hypothetical protein